MIRPLHFLLVVASVLITLSGAVLAENAATTVSGNSSARAIIGPISGVDYGPFRNGESPSGPCFSPTEIAQDIPILATTGNYVRVYSVAMPYSGQPCDYYDMVVSLLENGLNVIPSAAMCAPPPTDPTCGTNNATEVAYLIQLVNWASTHGYLAQIPFVVVGSEAVSFGGMTWGDNGPNDLQPFVLQVKNALSGVKVTTAEIYYQYLAPPVTPCQGGNGFTFLGNTVDVIFVNIHPYNEGFQLNQAVNCILNVYGSLNSAYPLNKPIVISEFGWPSYTSVADQQTFWQNFIAAARQSNIEYTGFEAFDEQWKFTVNTPYESTWGLWYATRQPKVPGGIVSFNPASPVPGIVDTHDFNGDGKSDILWRDTAGDVGLWLMSGAQILQGTAFNSVATNWAIVGQRSFTGTANADILWRDTVGDVGMWIMNGTQIVQAGSFNAVPLSWSIVGTGDFNGDGKADILWLDNQNNVGIWLMNGTQILQAGVVGQLPANWIVVGSDMKGDIFLRNTVTGDVGMWVMNGTKVAQTADFGPVPLTWTVGGIGDFDGNGSTDILFRDSAGDVQIWLMSGDVVLSTTVLGNVPTNWSIAETGDYNGDGKSDILWTDSAGDVAIWFMNGVTVSSVTAYGNIGTSWRVQSLNAD